MTDDDPPVVILDSHAHVVHSSIVGEGYDLSVWLPPSYASSTARYPVLYELDASATFGLAAHGTFISIVGEVVPEMIVVGIDHSGQSTFEGDPRSRDFSPVRVPNDEGSGHAAAFVECLRTELLPFIDQRYRTEISDRTLWGHSFGGALALHLLLEKPGLFHRYIATSPAVVVEGQALLDPGTWPSPGSALPGRLFVSVGSADDEYRPHIESFNPELRQRNYRELRFDTAELPGYGHIGAAATGFLAGLRTVFAP
jgi:predicted alpha/beta superfamily hydrolase